LAQGVALRERPEPQAAERHHQARARADQPVREVAVAVEQRDQRAYRAADGQAASPAGAQAQRWALGGFLPARLLRLAGRLRGPIRRPRIELRRALTWLVVPVGVEPRGRLLRAAVRAERGTGTLARLARRTVRGHVAGLWLLLRGARHLAGVGLALIARLTGLPVRRRLPRLLLRRPHPRSVVRPVRLIRSGRRQRRHGGRRERCRGGRREVRRHRPGLAEEPRRGRRLLRRPLRHREVLAVLLGLALLSTALLSSALPGIALSLGAVLLSTALLLLGRSLGSRLLTRLDLCPLRRLRGVATAVRRRSAALVVGLVLTGRGVGHSVRLRSDGRMCGAPLPYR